MKYCAIAVFVLFVSCAAPFEGPITQTGQWYFFEIKRPDGTSMPCVSYLASNESSHSFAFDCDWRTTR